MACTSVHEVEVEAAAAIEAAHSGATLLLDVEDEGRAVIRPGMPAEGAGTAFVPGPALRRIAHERTTLVADAEELGLDPELGGGRWVAAPLDGGGERLTVIAAALVTDEESEAEAVAEIAACAEVASALIAHHREDRRQAEAYRALLAGGTALNRASNLPDVLQSIADTLRAVVGARYAAIGVLCADGAALEHFVTSGIGDDERRAIGDLPEGRGLLGALLHDPRPLIVDDIAADPGSCGMPSNHLPMTSFLGAPVVLGGTIIGSLYLTEKLEGRFTQVDEQAAVTMAARTATAIGAWRRVANEQRRVVALETVRDLGAGILTTLDPVVLLPLIARTARRFDHFETIGIGVRDDQGVVFAHVHGRSALALEGLRVPSLERAAISASAGKALDDHAHVETILLECLGETVGVLVAGAPEPVSAEDRALLEIFAAQAAIALGNAQAISEELARLGREAAARTEEAREDEAAQGLRRVIAAQEAERARIARELHDEAGQALTALLLLLKTLEAVDDLAEVRRRLPQLRETVRDVATDLRVLATELRAPSLDREGLQRAIERQAEAFRETTGVEIETLFDELPENLPYEIQVALFRVTQEALANIARHSGAAGASVILSVDGPRLRLVVEDDGRGFDTAAETDRLGIAGIAERVELVGGRLRVESSIEAGTVVVVDLELER
jgi:signal transduction histidine kinase